MVISLGDIVNINHTEPVSNGVSLGDIVNINHTEPVSNGDLPW